MNNPSLAYDLFCDTQQENLEYIYRGEFDSSITDNLLALAEESLRIANHKTTIKKRVYLVLVEGLQNITRHQLNEQQVVNIEQCLFVLQRRQNSYFITTGNIIYNEEIDKLKKQIDSINALDTNELKEYHNECLAKNKLSDKGGAGLGLIDMARKSSNLLSYNFTKISDKHSYFYLLVEIQFNVSKNVRSTSEGDIALGNIQSMHKMLKEQQITLNYSGVFTQHTMVNLLNIIKKQFRNTMVIRRKMYHVVVEMLQNLVKHADHYKINEIVGKHGIFFISNMDYYYEITTGNYIKNEKLIELVERINFVNSLNVNELDEQYNINMSSSHTKFSKNNSSQLGILDMRLKSQHKLLYHITNIDKDVSFFTISVSILSE